MKRVSIVGSSGAGKTTLALRLGEKYNLPVIHLDKLFWKPGWIESTKEEWESTQRALCADDSWIVDGNYNGTTDIRFESCDVIIFLDVNRFTCLYRVIKRTLTTKTRIDMAKGCEERFDLNFLKYVWQFPDKTRPNVLQKIDCFRGQKTIIQARSVAVALSIFQEIKDKPAN